jgi:hypothetical protein
VEGAVKRAARCSVLLLALALQGCGLFSISDKYGNSYGGFYDYGNKYQWQLATCQDEVTAHAVVDPFRKRYMECCMWRHGVPIDDSNGCTAPPYSG